MLRTIIFTLLICMCSVSYGHGRYGRSDATNSPAYHGRHYQINHYYPAVVVAPRCYNYYMPVTAPRYTPIDYYGRPYGAYHNYYVGPRTHFYFRY